jgi:hypothetical protein
MQVQLEYGQSIALAEAFCFIVDVGVASSNANAAAVGPMLQPTLDTASSHSLASLRILSASLTKCVVTFQELVLGASSLGSNRESAVRHGAGLPRSASLFLPLLHRLTPNVSSQLRMTFEWLFSGDLFTLSLVQTFVLPQSSSQVMTLPASPDPASRRLAANHGHDELEHDTSPLRSGASTDTLKDVNMKSTEVTRSGTPAMRKRVLIKGNWVCSRIHHNIVVTYWHLDLIPDF